MTTLSVEPSKKEFLDTKTSRREKGRGGGLVYKACNINWSVLILFVTMTPIFPRSARDLCTT